MGRRNSTPEREFQRTVVQLLELFGYEVNHTFPLMTRHGWRTGTTAVGWPDLLAVRVPRQLAIEVKGDHTPLEPAQRAWLSLFAGVPCVRAWVLRPTDPWADIQAWVSRPKDAPRVHGFEPMEPAAARRLLADVRRNKAATRAAKRKKRSEPGLPGATPTLPLG